MESKIIVFLEHKTTNWHDLEKSFQDHNFVVIHADSEKEAVDLIENSTADAVLADWKYGKINIHYFVKMINDLMEAGYNPIMMEKLITGIKQLNKCLVINQMKY